MTRVTLVAAIALLLSATPARADLIDLGNGMIYDSVQDLTWLQDAKYSQTSGVDSDGKMPFAEAVTWAATLEHGGFDDWRLPRWFDLASPLSQTSELARLFADLGWVSGQYEYAFHNGVGPFLNVLTPAIDRYWLDQTHNVAWHEVFVFDVEDGGVESPQGAWAVRDGSAVAGVSEPSTLLMFGIGLVALVRRRRAHTIEPR